jgi:hypothetical protein
MKHTSNTFRWSAVAALAAIAISGLIGACNSHPVEFRQATDRLAVHDDVSPDTAAAVDILWVIDNSGSMCEEQEALRTNFDKFISQITDRNIDFHIGVTTTQMDSYPREPVALPGHLQSTPQPLPAALPGCRGEAGDENDPMDGFAPIREAIALATECTRDPSKWESLASVSDDEIACQMKVNPQAVQENCSCAANNECDRKNLFPTYENNVPPYRDISKILRFSDYLDPQTGQLTGAQEDQLRDDFACMSFVGTSGYTIEKGLQAAAKAVSPELTGGTVEEPTDDSAPNYGFLRDSAKFSVIFVTDENDCSHGDTELDIGTGCGTDICSLANHDDWEGPPLTEPEALADRLKENLSESKGYEVKSDAIIAASIHGVSKRYGATPDYPSGQPPKNMAECEAITPPLSSSLEQIAPCNTPDFGTAFSGDRYEDFLRQFDPNQIFPKIPADPTQPLEGLICSPGRIAGTLEDIGRTIAGSVASCIYQVPHICSTSEECPAYAYGEGTKECLAFGESGDSYCNSGIQLRMYPGDNTMADLEAHEYCVPGSIGSEMVPDGCVIKPEMYTFSACPGAETEAINLDWTDSKYFNALSGYNVELVYTLLTEEQEQAAPANGGADAGN